MKKILGLDLGTASIGWALIAEKNGCKEIIGMGCRIIPLSTEEKDEFSSGNQISKNQKRTDRRTLRKGYDRYQLRRRALTRVLIEHGFLPDENLFKLDKLGLWKIRAEATIRRVELNEFGRILYHLNQKRGYKSSRSEANLDKKDTECVAEVKGRHQEIKNLGLTIAQKFYAELVNDSNFRIKQQVFPREAYIEEFDAICSEQQKHYPGILTDELIHKLKNDIIYHQRPLKFQKSLINTCELESFYVINKGGKKVHAGPRVAPRSSPLFQVCKLWESINNLNLKNKNGGSYNFSIEDKKRIFNYLNDHKKITASELYNLLGLSKNDGWYHNKQIERGIQGNLTRSVLMEHDDKIGAWLDFHLEIDETNDEVGLIDQNTGEVIEVRKGKVISPLVEKQPLYQLWHTIYSISDLDQCEKALVKRFGFDSETARKLAAIDFKKNGFGNKSVKAVRKILPYLMEGYVYSDACAFAGYNHSNSLTKEENLQRLLLDKLPNLPKNSLRQPVVEKILNQMINLVNSVIDSFGKPDEIRVELTRELKQSKEERNDTFKSLKQRERENEQIRKILEQDFGIRATRNNVIKYRLFKEIDNEDSRINAICIYCGQHFGITDALSGDSIDVEHIIPKASLFDDSQSNKTLSHRHCNEKKGKLTAYDYMLSKGPVEFDAYLHRVDRLFKTRLIGKVKRDKLLMPQAKIPKDFIDRQMRETQYISRKSREILFQACRNVWSTSGSVTEYLRRIWGWDDVLHNLQFPLYKHHGLTETVQWESNGQSHIREVIRGWSKRNDHRHHAIDALVIACTRQGFIHRINNLSSQGNRDEMFELVANVPFDLRENLSLLEKYLIIHRPFTTAEVEQKAAEILISFKAGKKVATVGKRIVRKSGQFILAQDGIIVPRGPLSDESVYGKIKTAKIDFKDGHLVKHPLKFLFYNPHLIVKPYIKRLVDNRLAEFGGDAKLALASVRKHPIFLDEKNETELSFATCYSDEYVKKYPIEDIKPTDVRYIVDKQIQRIVQRRFEQYKGREKEAFKEPLWYDIEKRIAIRSIRCFTCLSSVEPLKRDESGKAIGFVMPGNNHHVAFYKDNDGNMLERVCTFWHAVERKRYGLPVIIKNPYKVWNHIFPQNPNLPQSFLEKLPPDGSTFVESMQQNEMFILGMEQEDLHKALIANDKINLSNHLYRVQKITVLDYSFRHHIVSQVVKSGEDAKLKKCVRVTSIPALSALNPIKITVGNLGEVKLALL